MLSHLLHTLRPPLNLTRNLALCLLLGSRLPWAAAQALPAELDAALARAGLPPNAVSLLVFDADQGSPSHARLSLHAQQVRNPASVMKLVTTYAALDLLGPAYTWTTPVYLEGNRHESTFDGTVYLRGQGDPTLVEERLWLLLRNVQGIGITHIHGDVVLDRSAFVLPASDPGQFDGEALRPYNASPDALLINYKSILLTLRPDPATHQALVQSEPPLYGVQVQAQVPLLSGDCGDYRGRLKADFSDPLKIRFLGGYGAHCGEKVWPVAYADPASYAPRAVHGLWLSMGGSISGSVRYGDVPTALLQQPPAIVFASPALADVIRDINKFSNNVMAQQLFLTLGRERQHGDGSASPGDTSSPDTARHVVEAWWKQRIASDDVPVLDNGSGLSRQARVSAQALGTLLQTAFHSPNMSELMGSLPISGTDGTLKRDKSGASAHLKTGTLDGVSARAGYVDGNSGKRYVLVALINHPNATTEAARQFLEALVAWTARDQ